MKLEAISNMVGSRLFAHVRNVSLAALIGVSGWAGPATAQELSDSHLAAARQAIDSTASTNRLDNILPTMAQNAKSELIRANPNQEASISVIVDEVAISLAPRRGMLETEVAKIFANTFTEGELEEISGFFSTETGQKFLAQSPIVLREIERAAQVWSNGLRRDMNAAVREKLSEAGLQ